MFEKFDFTPRQIKTYFNSAKRDFKIADQNTETEVVFRFGYDSLIKCAISICAENGLRVKARQGHHRELIEKLAEILDDENIEIWGNKMRSKRNWDLYGGGIITSKEASEYKEWVAEIVTKTEGYLAKQNRLI